MAAARVPVSNSKLSYIAIHPKGALTKPAEIDRGAHASAGQALDLLGATRKPDAFACLALRGRTRQQATLGAKPPLPEPLYQARTASSRQQLQSTTVLPVWIVSELSAKPMGSQRTCRGHRHRSHDHWIGSTDVSWIGRDYGGHGWP